MKNLKSEGKKPAVGERVLMGITKASLTNRVIYFSCFISKKQQEF
jgi:hypothetical protein